MRQLLFIIFMGIFVSVQGQNTKSTSQSEQLSYKNEKQANTNYTSKVISSLNNTWGYDIYKGEKMFIHQTNIPGMPGNNGFKSKSDAKKVARLVIEKLKKGEMPPSVTIDEMKNIKVLLTN